VNRLERCPSRLNSARYGLRRRWSKNLCCAPSWRALSVGQQVKVKIKDIEADPEGLHVWVGIKQLLDDRRTAWAAIDPN
jgi:hypothetical protein